MLGRHSLATFLATYASVNCKCLHMDYEGVSHVRVPGCTRDLLDPCTCWLRAYGLCRLSMYRVYQLADECDYTTYMLSFLDFSAERILLRPMMHHTVEP